MNITPQAPNLFTPTVLNPNTETLRRENHQREIITQPAALNQSAAEKGVASDKERGRTPAQNNENIDFASLKEKAEQANQAISEQKGEHGNGQNSHQHQDHQQEQAAKKDEQQDSNQANEQDGNISEQKAQALEISQLQRRDQEVKAHELAHATIGGSVTGAPSYTFETGPDGKRYAVEGEVSVDLSIVKGNPEATIAKMQKVHAAALAPANPSVQDAKVAANAAQIILQAQSELLTAQHEHITQAQIATENTNYSVAKETSNTLSNSNSERDFDTLINQTIEAQEQVAPTRSEDVIQRAGRIESFYQDISQAYNKPATHQFELTA
ncbi:MAG: putative metalloprotease CJM1_0395 family protein [Litorilituus sp.]|jgi:hypothetical protein|nr:putative metalloprotease CJM1_0395 family protein [Litorilituus sp.]